MIFVKNIGRMGNQMFCYAFAYSASRRLGTSFCLNHLRDLSYFTLHGRTKLSNNLQKIPFKTAKVLGLTRQQSWENIEVPPEETLRAERDWTIYTGYFQSEDYFAECRDEIRAAFTPHPPLQESFRQVHSRFLNSGKPLLAIHVRGDDYAGWNFPKENVSDVRLPRLYFERALAAIPDWSAHEIVILTDDPAYAIKIVPPEVKAPVLRGTPMDDFQLLMAADALIISNSTFAWWGAWLNPKPQKRVFGPRDWLGFKLSREIPSRVQVRDWNWISAV